MEAETRKLMVRNIPPRLKGKIARRVEQAGTNMNDVLVGLLADRFEVDFQPSGVKRLSIGKSGQALLTMPAQLKILIKDTAYEQGTEMNNVVLEIFCDEFGIPFKPTGRWPQGKAVAAT